jgi:hypothetical protein
MRRQADRDDQQPVEPKHVSRFLGDDEVADVRGVELAAEDADSQATVSGSGAGS